MGDIALLDHHAIAMAARDSVTPGLLQSLRDAAIGDFCCDYGSDYFRTRAEPLITMGLVAPGIDTELGYDAEFPITEAGCCLLAMVDGRERSGGV